MIQSSIKVLFFHNCQMYCPESDSPYVHSQILGQWTMTQHSSELVHRQTLRDAASPLREHHEGRVCVCLFVRLCVGSSCWSVYHERGEDHYMDLLHLRNIPTKNTSTFPQTNKFLITCPRDETWSQNNPKEHNLHHRQMQTALKTQNRKLLKPLNPGDKITFKSTDNSNRWRHGTVWKRIDAKSYELFSVSKFFHRARVHIKKVRTLDTPILPDKKHTTN